MGHLAYAFESLAPPDIFYRHIEDEEHLIRHTEIIEDALRTRLPRDYRVVAKEEGRKIQIQHGGLGYEYEFIPAGAGTLVKFRVEWRGLYNLILFGSRKKMIMLVMLTDLLTCEHTALLLMEKNLKEGA
jgi:hypothetical protein